MHKYFRKASDQIYLNAGSMSLSPVSVIDQIQKEKEILENNPTEALFGAWDRMWQMQLLLARFFKADPRYLFMRTNVTYVMNDGIMALKLPKNSEILVSDIEYGAVVKICQHKALMEGHELKVFSLHDKGQDPATVTEQQLINRLEKALTPKTKMVMLSHVMTGSGLTLPIEKMAKLLRSRGIFFMVDGAHGAGSLDLDFSNTDVDFYGSNLHKWLMGPKGTGFGFVSPRLREHLEPKFAGWTAIEVPPHFYVFGQGDDWTARWAINSTHNFSDFYGIPATLDFWSEMGVEKIRQRQQSLWQLTAKEVTAATSWRCLSLYPAETRGPLIAFEIPQPLAKMGFQVMKKLYERHRLVVSMTMIQHEWRLRLSPHVYNTEDEILKAADCLKRSQQELGC